MYVLNVFSWEVKRRVGECYGTNSVKTLKRTHPETVQIHHIRGGSGQADVFKRCDNGEFDMLCWYNQQIYCLSEVIL